MCANKPESMHFYDYLCREIGSKKEVKLRRLTFMAIDTSHSFVVSSGSKGEGLNLKGSDFDLMLIDQCFRVYESETEMVQNDAIKLLIDNSETPSSFTRLRLYTNYKTLDYNCRTVLEQHGMQFLMSNKLFKQRQLQLYDYKGIFTNIHGPCLSDDNGTFDFAHCLKCDKWVSQAEPWINRSRSSWLSPEIISKIIKRGVLFVPIGFKDSVNDDLEWRISFSVAEKMLIFSFNHTQLLCYALLKIVLKEIIEKDEDLKGLLCSYYLKTLMFWISDDSDPAIWRPDNIIQCFKACLQRLLYSVEYSTLFHYFISNCNLFGLKLSKEFEKRKQLTNLLNNLYHKGIACFSASETLHDYTRFQTTNNKTLHISSRLVHDVLYISTCYKVKFNKNSLPLLLNRLLLHCKTDLSHIFLHYLSRAHQYVPQIPCSQHKRSNIQSYFKYKYDLSHLLIGVNSDAVAGWLMLASFFYVHQNYIASIDLTNYALSQMTDEKCDNRHVSMDGVMPMTLKQKSALDMIKRERLTTILKAFTIDELCFKVKSQIIPKQLQQDVINYDSYFLPLIYVRFLKFLCCFHLRDLMSCKDAMHQLVGVFRKIQGKAFSKLLYFYSSIFVGIAGQMIGDTVFAKECFKFASQIDDFNVTTAGIRLRELRLDI